MIDLHTHTTFSDGASSPDVLLQEAHSIGLRALAITDHDTFAGFDSLVPPAYEPGLELICGIELSTQLHGENGRPIQVHLLGYFLDKLPSPQFKDWLKTISATRCQRNLDLMAHLQAQGLTIDWPDLPLPPEAASRTHFARLLVTKGYVPDTQSAFRRYLSDRSLSGIDRKLPPVREAIERVCSAGGLSSLAHPIRLPFDEPALRLFVKAMASYGLHALEAYHSDHSGEDTSRFLKLASDLNLLVTGGSDYHGRYKRDISLGKGRSNLCLPYTLLERLKQFRCSPLP